MGSCRGYAVFRRERGLLVGAPLGLVGATAVHVSAKESFREWLLG